MGHANALDAPSTTTTTGEDMTTPDHPQYNDIFWHAMNYRGAFMLADAQAAWEELEACIDRKVAAKVAAERARLWEGSKGDTATEARLCAARIRRG